MVSGRQTHTRTHRHAHHDTRLPYPGRSNYFDEALKFGRQTHLPGFLPARRLNYASAVLAVTLCLFVCLSQVALKEIPTRSPSRIRALLSGTLSRTVDLENISVTACRSLQRVVSLARQRWTLSSINYGPSSVEQLWQQLRRQFWRSSGWR